jgi:DnaJ-class molecular chaperone
MFKQINRAYEVLSNADKRQVYDQQGMDGLERLER